MKRYTSAAVLLVCLLCMAGGAFGRGNGLFSQLPGGAVLVDGLYFQDMRSYVASDYFRQAGKRCGTPPPVAPPMRPGLMRRAQSDCTMGSTTIQTEYASKTAVYEIPVVVHIIKKTDGAGEVSNQRVADQIQVLNEDFRAMLGTLGENGYDVRIQFTLEDITRTVNDDWYTDSTVDEEQYKNALAWDTSKYLNIYTNDCRGNLGYITYFPQELAANPSLDTSLDGVVVLHKVFGGRGYGINVFDQGRTATHEVGHYLGLFHTFEGCTNTYSGGDLVVDTPGEDTPTYVCSQTTSCNTPDDIHNYMNYSPDSCMEHFTPEQANRMVCTMLNYRPSLYSEVNGTASSSVNPLLGPLQLLLH